ncbi:helix-turn-helix domain-containing protein [Furfurilactobacillus milii]|uniref:helix-turn-helix domain-containing protein n=1 Tax=Furfurilactobacillus milii TaxID=2888272 RepID=UPI0013701F80|nr:helix-turn-helix transcriptional regulator [Furfurilactobacillus milii]
MYNGRVIRDARLAQHLTQAELGAGICDQPAISHIENSNELPSDRIIKILLNRLNLRYSDVIDNKNVNANYALPEIEELISKQQYQLATERLKALDRDTLTTHTTLEADFLIAYVNFHLNKNYDQAIFEFNRNILGDEKQLIDPFEILSLDQLGLIYCLKKELDNARFYFQQIPDLLSKANIASNTYWITLIYHDLAFFYSRTHEYKLSNHYAKRGLELLKENHQSQFVDSLSFTIGKNYANTTQDWKKSSAKHFLQQAITFGKFKGNLDLVKRAEAIIVQHEQSYTN